MQVLKKSKKVTIDFSNKAQNSLGPRLYLKNTEFYKIYIKNKRLNINYTTKLTTKSYFGNCLDKKTPKLTTKQCK